ncbi:hypothetical protein C7C46_02310 [Streptomyces tateyamensis]|uniref:DUF3558 domain-containing protein n=1 Tax=Streptomyces tateyamensis TaxID=565073 RepID=A0A2V4PS89_9ACTN|nr:hypothetical protein [Streptomyces tateyamensis]PYC87893.1 hypothetical protein C7C46_02310 [Streptomyces tateyamensis]
MLQQSQQRPTSRRRALFIVAGVLVLAAAGTAFAVRASEPSAKNPADVAAHPCPATRPFKVAAAPSSRRGVTNHLVPDHPAVATFCRYDEPTRPDDWKLRDSVEVRGAELASLVTALDQAPHSGGCPAIRPDGELLGELYFEYPSGAGVEVLVQGLLPVRSLCETAGNGTLTALETSKVTLPLG